MYGNVFVRRKSDEGLEAFAGTVFDIVGITRGKKRTSSNFVGETYFIGTALAIDLRVALSDEVEFADYDFWLSLKRSGPRIGDDNYLDQCGEVLARLLFLNGYQVCRAINFGRAGEMKRMTYWKSEQSDGDSEPIESRLEDLPAAES
jgi:hypothetical protein